jgi:hypothetical protein
MAHGFDIGRAYDIRPLLFTKGERIIAETQSQCSPRDFASNLPNKNSKISA